MATNLFKGVRSYCSLLAIFISTQCTTYAHSKLFPNMATTLLELGNHGHWESIPIDQIFLAIVSYR